MDAAILPSAEADGSARPALLPAEASAPTEAAAPTLAATLVESRQRWRRFATLASDILFEVDAAGRLAFVAPGVALGWPADVLVGQPARTLLADPAGPDPFGGTALDRRPIWFRTARGTQACMALSTTRLLDEAGQPAGIACAARDITEQQHATSVAAETQRRSEALDHILDGLRQEATAPSTMRALLETASVALGVEGLAVVELPPDSVAEVTHLAGPPPPGLEVALACLPNLPGDPRQLTLPDGAALLICPMSTRFGDRAALIAWRRPGARPLTPEDRALAGSVAGLVRIMLEHDAIQRELARQGRADPLTGLMNRRAFMEEAARRLERLHPDSLPGTLLVLEVDRLGALNEAAGHETGDAVLQRLAAMLRRTFRPTDLLARLGGDTFAAWLDGADAFTAAERAEGLRRGSAGEFAPACHGHEPPGLSIGVASRAPAADEPLENVLHRAAAAMHLVKRAGGGHWRVCNAGPAL